MRLVHRGIREIGLVGGDQRQAAAVRLLDQPVLGLQLFGETVALQLDIEPVTESRRQALQEFGGFRLPPPGHKAVEHAVRTSDPSTSR